MIQIKAPYTNAVISHDDQALHDIHLKSKNVAVYHRDIALLNQELEQIAEQAIECRASGTVEEISAQLEDFFKDKLPDNSSLLADVTVLLKLFKNITKASSFRLMLASVTSNMCRKFHTDINKLRMLCTYVGPGTLWLPDEIVDYKALQARKEDHEIVIDRQNIQQVPTGDVVLLKGALYPDANPILHRSPSIEESGEKRLLLRIDTNENLFA